MTHVGLVVKEKVCYVGVQIGHLNAEQVYAPSMAKMNVQVAFQKTLPLELSKKVAIFKTWIRLVVQLTTKVLEPSVKVLLALNVIYKMALGMSSCDINPAMVAEPMNRGVDPNLMG